MYKIKIINCTRRCDESCKCDVRPCWCDERVDCECSFREHAIIYRPATKAWAADRGGETRHPPPSPARRSGVRIPLNAVDEHFHEEHVPAAAATRHEVASVSCVRIEVLAPPSLPRRHRRSRYRPDLYPVRPALMRPSPLENNGRRVYTNSACSMTSRLLQYNIILSQYSM